jgi:hypothetical protein
MQPVISHAFREVETSVGPYHIWNAELRSAVLTLKVHLKALGMKACHTLKYKDLKILKR